MTLTDIDPKETDEMGDVAVVAVPEIRAHSTASTPNVDGNGAMSPAQQQVEGDVANAVHSNKNCIIGCAVSTVIAVIAYILLGIYVDWALGTIVLVLPVLYCLCWTRDTNKTRRERGQWGWDGGGGGGWDGGGGGDGGGG